VDQDKVLFYNFSIILNKDDDLKKPIFDNAIYVSGFFDVRGSHSFKNAIISNMTFTGDFDKLDFEGACLVNVHFYKASFFQLMKIKRNANFYKNISSH
jgi:uncharacterized protein YjbI with pentapeptide repeats